MCVENYKEAVIRISFLLILTAAMGLILSQTLLVSEVTAVSEVECRVVGIPGIYDITRECCEFEVDIETGERTNIGCWRESCDINEEGVEYNCEVYEFDPVFNPSDRPLGEQQEVQPVPPPTPENDVTNLAPGQGEILLTPPTTTTQDEGITPPPLFGRNIENAPLAGGFFEQPIAPTTPLPTPPPLFGRNDANVLGDGGFTQQPFTTSETLPSPTGPSIFPEDGILKQPSAQEPEEQSVEEENEQVIARDDSDDDDDGPVPPECPLTGPIPPDCTMKPKFPTEIVPD